MHTGQTWGAETPTTICPQLRHSHTVTPLFSKTAFVSVDDLPQVSEGVTEDTGNNETNNQ